MFSLQKTQASWQKVFYLAAGISLFSAITYTILGTGVEQPWGRMEKEDELPAEEIPEKKKEIEYIKYNAVAPTVAIEPVTSNTHL